MSLFVAFRTLSKGTRDYSELLSDTWGGGREGGSLFSLRGPRRLCLDPDDFFLFGARSVFCFSARFARLTLDSIQDFILEAYIDSG